MSNHVVAVALAFPLLLLLIAPHPASTTTTNPPIALPGCQDRCGNISISYPFGIGSKCSHNSYFNITCGDPNFFDPVTKPYLMSVLWNLFDESSIYSKAVIFSIDLGGTSPVLTGTLSIAAGTIQEFERPPGLTPANPSNLDMRGSPYVLAGTRNSLLLMGCVGNIVIRNARNETVAGCSTICTNLTTSMESANNSCYGTGCCQTTIPTSLDYYDLVFQAASLANASSGRIWSVVADTSYIANNSINATFFDSDPNIPALLLWAVPGLETDSPKYSNSLCELDANLNGYTCRCRYEYSKGNPYLPNGCQVIKECEQCPSSCASVVVGSSTSYKCPATLEPKKSAMSTVLGLGISFGSVLLSAVFYGIFILVRERKQIKQRQQNFKRNGGLLLQQQTSPNEGGIERTKVFTCNELERATDNFNENRIIGRGGQGTVYKGMLTNGTIVAIKKSKKIDESQLGQFINEVVILSQTNHRNVVKLFGCCLETEVPLLVYEFVLNGTLFQHIHNSSDDFRITWKMRLQIAAESAEAVAYLHSSSHAPIYHRDIKTSNILLDDKYRAKVSDFGTSKTILLDQTHVTTCVQGTFGYIDPEFFQSNHFTDKSDVYSFGIVLVELLTSKKPIYADYESMESRSLASEFLFHMENSHLYDMVDAEVLREAHKEELDGVANLAKQCLHLNGKQRPTMKEVATTLHVMTSQNHIHNPSTSTFSEDKARDVMIN